MPTHGMIRAAGSTKSGGLSEILVQEVESLSREVARNVKRCIGDSSENFNPLGDRVAEVPDGS